MPAGVASDGVLGERWNFAVDVFATNAERAGKTAYTDDRRSITYGELERDARRFARLVAENGLRREERIVLFMLDSIELPIAYLGALYAGVIPVVVNTMLQANDVAYVIRHAEARAVVASAALAKTYEPALAQVRSGGHDPQLVVADPELPLPALLADRPADTYADDIAFWLYSSGSTGKPKAVVHTHANIHHTVELYGKPVLGLHPKDFCGTLVELEET